MDRGQHIYLMGYILAWRELKFDNFHKTWKDNLISCSFQLNDLKHKRSRVNVANFAFYVGKSVILRQAIVSPGEIFVPAAPLDPLA